MSGPVAPAVQQHVPAARSVHQNVPAAPAVHQNVPAARRVNNALDPHLNGLAFWAQLQGGKYKK